MKIKKFVRYPDVEYSDNRLLDYHLAGRGEKEFDLSKKGKERVVTMSRGIGEEGFEVIYCSPAKPCRQMANIIGALTGIKVRGLKELANVKHDVSLLLDRDVNDEELTKDELIAMRKNFLKFFLEDGLSESKKSIENRLSKLKKYFDRDVSCLMIGHGLIMKLFYLYIKTRFDCPLNDLVASADIYNPFYGSLTGFSYPSLKKVSYNEDNRL